MERRDKAKRLMRALARMKEATLIVEGKRDQRSLEGAGFRAFTFAWAVAHPSSFRGLVVVLTDLDREGDRKAAFLEGLLLPYARVDTHLRKELAYLLKLSHFEGFWTRLRKVAEELGCDYGKGVY